MRASQQQYDALISALNDSSANGDVSPSCSASPSASPTEDLLDAYSKTVVRVVEQAGSAVIAIQSPRGVQRRGGSGSGVLLTPDGFALTNSHVVSGRERLTATTHEGDTLDASLIGDDPATDLALVRLSARDLPTAQLGDSDALRVGQLVVAMGSPFGLQATVSSGIVSAMGRSMRGIGGRLIDGVIQHTAPINPGNSGGPLVDSRCQIVGLNTAMIAFAQGVGFAIPSNTARWVTTELISHGRVRRAVLGIAAATVQVPCRLARELDLLNESGVRVESVEPGSSAALGGLQPDDVIVSLDGRLVSSVDDLHRLLTRIEPSARMALGLLRNERSLALNLEARHGG